MVIHKTVNGVGVNSVRSCGQKYGIPKMLFFCVYLQKGANCKKFLRKQIVPLKIFYTEVYIHNLAEINDSSANKI